MSFILDALRKSEQQRQHGVAPSLFTVMMTNHVEKQPAFLLYGLFALSLISGGVLIGWLHPWQADSSDAVSEIVTSAPLKAEIRRPVLPPNVLMIESPPAIPPASISTPQPAVNTMQSPLAAELDQPLQVSKPLPEHAVDIPKAKLTRPSDPLALKLQAGPSVKATETSLEPAAKSEADDTTRDQDVIEFVDLPLSMQQEIPAISISAHAYSGVPAKRLVRINDHLLHEGDFLTPALKLEQITPDGMVFSYKKAFFRHGLQ